MKNRWRFKFLIENTRMNRLILVDDVKKRSREEFGSIRLRCEPLVIKAFRDSDAFLIPLLGSISFASLVPNFRKKTSVSRTDY